MKAKKAIPETASGPAGIAFSFIKLLVMDMLHSGEADGKNIEI